MIRSFGKTWAQWCDQTCHDFYGS